MLHKAAEIIMDVISYTSTVVGSLSDVREGLVFRSGEYGVDTGDSSVMETEEERKAKAAAGTTTTNIAAQGVVVSNAKSHINKINKYVPGLGTFIDIIFSPNFGLLLGMAGIALSFLSPLGPAVGIAAVVLGSAYMTMGLVMSAMHEQDRVINKQITTVVKELDKDLTEIANLKGKCNDINTTRGIGIDMEKVFSIMGGRQLINAANTTQTSQPYSWWKNPLQSLLIRFPMTAFSLGTGIATLNPLTIGLAVPMTLLGEASAARVDQRNSKVAASHAEEMTNIRNKMGLEKKEGKEGLEAYAEQLSEVKRDKMAMERFSNDYERILDAMQAKGITPTNENLQDVFQDEYLAKQPKVSIPTHTLTLGEAFLSNINNGFTWSKAMSANSPLVPEYGWAYNDNAYKYNVVRERVRTQSPELSPSQLDKKTDIEAKAPGTDVNQKLGIAAVDIDASVDKLAQTSRAADPNHWRNTVRPPSAVAHSLVQVGGP